MKKVFLLLIFFLTTSAVSAQQWCRPGSVWTYTFYGIGWTTVKGYNELRYVDTMTIDNRLCQKLSLFNLSYYPNVGGYTQYNYGTLVTNLNQQILTYRSAQNRFDTIAIFNAAPGAHWYERLYPLISTTLTPRRITVRDTGHAFINGISLKYLNVAYGDSLSVFTSTCASCFYRIYEMIGPTRGFMYSTSIMDNLDAYDDLGNFVCYYDNTFSPYSISGYVCTPNPAGINESQSYARRAIFPNPTKDVLRIEGFGNSEAQIYSSDGMLLLKLSLDEGNSSINLESLPSGLYFLELQNKSGMTSTHKVIRN